MAHGIEKARSALRLPRLYTEAEEMRAGDLGTPVRPQRDSCGLVQPVPSSRNEDICPICKELE